jgi:hypothetical protein
MMKPVERSAKYSSDETTSQSSKIIYDRVPDRLEITVRAVCGALLGLFVTFWIWRLWLHWDAVYIILLAISAVAFCAWFAAKKGDEFWYQVGQNIRWF